MAQPAYSRLPVNERRSRLLALGAELFARHPYEELSMRRIAREAGISKALLYHYFPSKQRFFAATLSQAAEEVARLTEPDPRDALAASLAAFLAWVEEHPSGYEQLIRGAAGTPEVRALVDRVRDRTADRIVAGLGARGPAARTAARGWLWFMDGAILDWLEHGHLSRDELRELRLRTLRGALA